MDVNQIITIREALIEHLASGNPIPRTEVAAMIELLDQRLEVSQNE